MKKEALRQRTGQGLAYALLFLSAFWVLTIRVPTALWFGPFTLNAYLTGVAALLAGVLFLLSIPEIFRKAKDSAEDSRLRRIVLLGALASLPFLLYSTGILLFDFRIEGFQNGLVFSGFALSVASLPFWLGEKELRRIASFLRFAVLVVPSIKIVSFVGGFDFYGEASYAIVAVLLLAWAVANTPRAWFDYMSPWLLLVSILLCNVRTAAVVAAALMVVWVFSLPISRVWKAGVSVISLGLSAVLLWLFVGNRFASSGDQGFAELLGEDSLLAGIGTTRRAEGWLYLLDSLPPGVNWFGQGAGLSSYLIDELLQIHHPHNEYLRIFFDFGIVGLALFLLGSLLVFVSLVVLYRKAPHDSIRAGAYMVPVVAAMAVTDNPLVFIYVMLPFAIVISAGLAKGMQPAMTTP